MRFAPFNLVALFFGTVAACASTSPGGTTSPPQPIHASDYNQKCASATDCVAINEGDPCGCPSCGNAAVNKSDQAKFNADFDARRKQCTGPAVFCPASCIYSETSCVAGACGVCHSSGCGVADAGVTDASHD